MLAVEDNSRGITESQQQKLFLIFKRFPPEAEGSGIGLHMLKRMIENRGGSIEVESQVEKGSTFRMYCKIIHAGIRAFVKRPKAR